MSIEWKKKARVWIQGSQGGFLPFYSYILGLIGNSHEPRLGSVEYKYTTGMSFKLQSYCILTTLLCDSLHRDL